MAGRPVYRADRDVIEECARRGVPDITARKLERWRRYLPARTVERLPGVRGSRTLNPPGYVDQVVALDGLLKSGLPLRRVPMGLFAQGFPMKPEVLREAYTQLYGEVRRGLTEGPALSNLPNLASADPADRADALAIALAPGVRRTTMGRGWTKRARRLASRGHPGQGDNVVGLFTSALSVTFTWLLAGSSPSADGVIEALTVAGFYDGQDPEAAGNHLASLNLGAMIAAIAEATEAHWLTARQTIEDLACHLELRRSVDQYWNPDGPLSDGLGEAGLREPSVRAMLIPVALLLDEAWRLSLREANEQYVAVRWLLEELPEKFHQFIRPDRTTELQDQPEAFRVELGSFLLEWSRAHPEDAVRLLFTAQ